MFKVNEPAEAIGFDSQWKIKKISVQDSTQTATITTNTSSTETGTSTDTITQTDVIETKEPEYDEQKLADFLKRLYPKVSKELNEAASSQVMKNYQAKIPNNAAHEKLVTSSKLSLQQGDFSKSVSCLSWNATGNKLAIGGVQQHDTWCHHKGTLFIYSWNCSNFGNPTGDELDGKLGKIKTSSCITAVNYHPTLPPILAVGSHNGELLIINTQNNENEQVIAKVSSAHKGIITQVMWIEDLDEAKNYVLATGSLDGFISIWDFNYSRLELVAKEKYQIQTPYFGKYQRQDVSTQVISKLERGILAFDFSKHFAEKFIVAAEGGLIAQCSRLGAKELSTSTKDNKILDPVFKYYRAHEGEITSISLSPDRPDLFVTSATNGEIHVYEMTEEEPGKIILPKDEILFAVWVPYSQNLIAACGVAGKIHFYDARNGKLMNSNILEMVEKQDGASLTCLAFHKSRISLVAAGTKDGIVQMWDIQWNQY